MNGEERPIPHPSVETAILGSEAVLYDERAGTVHHLNASACAIWMLLDGRTLEEIVSTLSQTTGVSSLDLRHDVERSIGQLRAAGLLAD